MLHRSTPPASQKAFLATPAYSGVEAGFAFALYESAKALESAGIASELAMFVNDCHVDDSRNRLVRQFLMTDCTDLVFLDSDLRWEAKDLVNLLSFDVDVVGGTYPLKQTEEGFPVRLKEARNGDLIEAEALPTGFLRIKRHVLQTLWDESPKYYGKKDNGNPTALIFERTLEGTVRWGGDYTFCRKWAKHGKLWLYPTPCFEHIGNKTWSGSYAHWLEKEKHGAVIAGINAIREGRSTPETMQAMFEEWGNPWAGDSGLLSAVALLTPNKTVLECGSGLTTAVMAASGASVVCLEHSPEFAERTWKACEKILTPEELAKVDIHVAPLKDGFYSWIPEKEYEVMVLDGPPRACGDRSKASTIAEHIPLLIVDDNYKIDVSHKFKQLSERVSIGYRTASH